MDNKFDLKTLKELAKKGKIPSVENLSELDAEYLNVPWEEKEYNYRLSPDQNINYITDKNNKTLGHIALDDDNVTRSVYINPENRRQGLAYKAHEALASKVPLQMDDANEPEIYKVWDKLKQNYPDKIEEFGVTGEGKPRLRFKDKLEKLKTGGFKSIPLIGAGLGLATALTSEDASAAIPLLNSADSLGPLSNSDEAIMENPKYSQKERNEALKRLLERK